MESTMSELCDKLAERGLPVRQHRIRHAISAGHLSKPRLSKSLNYHFSERQCTEVEQYFRKPQRQGRPTKTLSE